MTAYNREQYIAEAIESVLLSTYQNWELIIVDDGSKDDTVSIAQAFADKDKRIKIYVNERNLGDYPNRNKAASYAIGKYLKYLDSDDLIFPWALDVMVLCMEKYPEAAMGVSQYVGNIIYPKIFYPAEIYRLYYYRNLLLTAGPTGTIIRRDIFEQFGGFSGKRYVGDTELWLRIFQRNSLVLIPPGQFYWREHDGQQIAEERRDNTVEATRQELNETILMDDQTPLPLEERKAIITNLKSIKCRRLIQSIAKGKVSSALKRRKCLGLTSKDFITSLRKNKTVENLLPVL